MKKYLVLKAEGPAQLANESLRIKQGTVVIHPGYPVDPAVLAEFDDLKTAQKYAEEQIEKYNVLTSARFRRMQEIEKAKAESLTGFSMERERQIAMANAKVLTKEGKLIDIAAAEKRIAELEAELAARKAPKNTKRVDAMAYLDQKAETAVKRVASAAKKGQLKKEDVEEIIAAEKEGKSRKNVLDKLKDLTRSDAVFGKLFK